MKKQTRAQAVCRNPKLSMIGLCAVLLVLSGLFMMQCKPKQPAITQLTGTVTISGTMKAGQTVTVSVGNSNGTPEMFTYQWTRDGEENIINGKTGETYTITEDDIGLKLGVVVSYTGTDITGTIFGETASVVEEIAKVQPAASKNLSFGGKITVSSRDEYLRGNWNNDTNKVKTVIESGYEYNKNIGIEYMYTDAFAAGVRVVLAKNSNLIWEVKEGTLSFRTDSISTINAETMGNAVSALAYGYDDSLAKEE